GRKLAARSEDAQRDREIEAARILGQLGRGEIDRDAARRKFEASVVERGAHAVACFAHFRIRQSDDVKGGQSRPQVYFHGHFRRVDTRERAACHGGNRHSFPLAGGTRQPLPRLLSSSTMRASSSASFACARSSSFCCTSKSSRNTRSKREKPAASMAFRFFSTSCAGELRKASLMRSFSSSKKRLSIMLRR